MSSASSTVRDALTRTLVVKAPVGCEVNGGVRSVDRALYRINSANAVDERDASVPTFYHAESENEAKAANAKLVLTLHRAYVVTSQNTFESEFAHFVDAVSKKLRIAEQIRATVSRVDAPADPIRILSSAHDGRDAGFPEAYQAEDFELAVSESFDGDDFKTANAQAWVSAAQSLGLTVLRNHTNPFTVVVIPFSLESYKQAETSHTQCVFVAHRGDRDAETCANNAAKLASAHLPIVFWSSGADLRLLLEDGLDAITLSYTHLPVLNPNTALSVQQGAEQVGKLLKEMQVL